jgi:hypothetical protein
MDLFAHVEMAAQEESYTGGRENVKVSENL